MNAEQFKEVLTYYALANGFSLWFEKSTKQMVIDKCGRRKEVLKDPSKENKGIVTSTKLVNRSMNTSGESTGSG